MSAAFTPGPWEAKRWTDEDADIYGWSFSAGGYLLPLSDMETDDPAICDANARLIAAAPLMLEALREILAINDEDQGTFRKRGGTRRGLSLVAAKEAISAATGEQP